MLSNLKSHTINRSPLSLNFNIEKTSVQTSFLFYIIKTRITFGNFFRIDNDTDTSTSDTDTVNDKTKVFPFLNICLVILIPSIIKSKSFVRELSFDYVFKERKEEKKKLNITPRSRCGIEFWLIIIFLPRCNTTFLIFIVYFPFFSISFSGESKTEKQKQNRT